MTQMQNTKNARSKGMRRAGAVGSVAAVALAAGTAVAAAPANAAQAPTNTWDKLAECESGGDWSTNTGNGFSGGLQFTPQTWSAHGGQGNPQNASKAEQIQVAKKVQQNQGWGAWPACSAKLGLSGSAGASDGATSQGSQQQAPKQQTQQQAPKQQTQQQAPKQQAPKQQPQVQEQAPKQQAPKQQTQQQPQAQNTGQAQSAQSQGEYYGKRVALPQNVQDSGKTYTVKSGDTLGKIAQEQGLNDWHSLHALNQSTVQDPNTIHVGQVLHLPAN